MSSRTPFVAQDFSAQLHRGTTLLEASAGTGKTYALAAIYLRLILERDLHVQQILVTTFTIAATAELRLRIRTLLRATHDAFEIGESKDKLISAVVEHWGHDATTMRGRLRQALLDFDESAIFTIHGFCQRVLSERAFESGVLSDQMLLPNENELIAEVATDYWRLRFYDCDDCLSAAAAVSKLSIKVLQNLLKARVQQPAAKILPPATTGDLDALCCNISDAFSECRAAWEKEEAELRRCFSHGGNAWAKGKHDKADEVRERLDAIEECFSGKGSFSAGHEALGFFARTAVEKNTRVRQSPPKLEFFNACERLSAQSARFALAVQLDFLHSAPDVLARKKERAGVQSYGDLLSRVQESLRGSAGELMASAIRARYQAALVDEFQDTDPLQDAIFQQLFGTGESWLFLIGDPKQAIYGFRGADVFTYLGAAARVEPGRAHTLGTNYRSAAALVRATNTLFSHGKNPFVIEPLDFHPVESCGEREEERFSGDCHDAPMRIWQWEGDSEAGIDDVRAEFIQATAAEIARLLSGGGQLGGRPVAPRDIAVLTLRNKDAMAVQRALTRLQVPSVLLESESVYASGEAEEMLALLTAMLRPGNEPLVRRAMLTGSLGLGFAELDALASDGSESERWLERFRSWHAVWLQRGFMAMFQHAMQQAGIAPRLLSLEGGERRLTNLLHLAELLQRAAMESRFGPRALVRWLGRQIGAPTAEDDEHEVRLERDDEAVRVVTVHKSKGLEYNIVFCPLLIRPPYRADVAIRFHDPESRELVLDLGSPDQAQHLEAARREALADEVRLLYVALTRARQRCDFIWGLHKGADISALGWLLHPAAGGATEPEEMRSARVLGLEDGGRQKQMAEIVSKSGGTIALHPIPSVEAPKYRPPGEELPHLAAATFRGTIVRNYRVSSFSSLTESQNPELPDYDAPHPVELPELHTLPEGIHAFPGGTRTGTFMHEIFEELEFTDRSAIEPLVLRKLAAYSYPVAQWGAVVTECVRRAMELPLADGFSLQELPQVSRIAEVEFFLPAGQIEAAGLRKILKHEELELDFTTTQGWLKGYIDLLAEHDRKFYIFDWKTNRLGDSTSAYTPAALNRSMASHRYGLQLHLYTLAVHRYLKNRLPGYRYDEHFGGAYYLFVRGIDPARSELGVVRKRPTVKTIEALEEWLGNRQPQLL